MVRAATSLLVLVAAACGGRAPDASPPVASSQPGPAAAARPATAVVSDSDASIATFEAKVAADVRDDVSRALLAALLLRRCAEVGDTEAARRAETVARSALALRPDSPAGAATLARALSAQGRHDEAIATCRGAPGFGEGNLDVLSALADVASSADRIEDATAAVDLLLARDGGAPTLIRSARVSRLRGDLERAAETARKAAKAARAEGLVAQEASAARVEEGRALLALGRFDEAARAFDQAIEVWPRSADAWLGRAGCDLRRARRAEALTAAERAAAIRDGPTERALVLFLSAPEATAKGEKE